MHADPSDDESEEDESEEDEEAMIVTDAGPGYVLDEEEMSPLKQPIKNRRKSTKHRFVHSM